MTPRIRATGIDMFAGAGGFTTGARAALIDVIFGINHWDVAIATHKKNHPKTLSGGTFTHLHEDAYFYDWNEAPLTDFILASPACIPPDGLLELANGTTRAARDVRVGDEVLTHMGRGRRIANVWTKTFSGQMVSLRMWGDSKQEVTVTEDHPVWVRRRGGHFGRLQDPEFVRADQVKAGDYVAFPRPKPIEGTAEAFVRSARPGRISYHARSRNSSLPGAKTFLKNTTKLWWLVGHFLGDGEARADRPQLGWSTGGSRTNLERVRRTLSGLGLSSWVKKKRKNNRVFCSSKHLHALCMSFGRLCHEKSIPAALNSLEGKFAKALVEGYLAADGSTRVVHGEEIHRATSTSLKLLQGVQRLCWGLGWSASISAGGKPGSATIEGRTVQCRETWAIQIKKKPHKQSRTKFDDTHVWRSVNTVTLSEAENLTVYDFEVEEDHTFCLPGVVLHNCQGHSRAATKGLERGRRGTAPHHDKIRAVANSVPLVASYKAADAIGTGRHPPVIVVENVPDFLKWSGYRGWRQQLQDAAEHDTYHVSEFVVNAADLGVPQVRNRAFVIAVPRTMSKVPFDLHVPKLPPARLTPFGVCVSKRGGNWVPLDSWPKQSVAQKALVRKAWFKKNGVKEPEVWAWQNADTNKPTLLTEPIRTITAKSANQWYLVRNTPAGPVMRSFLVDEYRAAMAFPDDYELPSAVGVAGKLLGNAVCPPVATAILDQLLRRL